MIDLKNKPVNMEEVKAAQKRVLLYMNLLFDLTRAIEQLPPSATRDELLAKHEKVLYKINDTIYDEIPSTMCWYGFMKECPGCLCEDCPGVVKMAQMNDLHSVEDFDKHRLENARKYYKEINDET